MNRSRLIQVLLTAMTIVGAANPARAQELLPGAESESQLTTRRMQRVYETALVLLERGQESDGLPLLQRVLDHPEDSLVPLGAATGDGEISLKGRVLERLDKMSRTERGTYQVLFGELAESLLAADSRSQRVVLEETVRRYFHTDAGFLAAKYLGATYFDRSDFFSAALVFDRLLNDPRLAGGERNAYLLKAAICWKRSGMPQQALSLMQSLPAQGSIDLGGDRLAFFRTDAERIAWLEAVTAESATSGAQDSAWSMFRGDPDRNATASFVPPIREANWEFRTVPLAEADDPRQLELVENDLQQLYEELAPHDFLLIPAMNPLIVDGKIVLRSLGNVKAIELETGELLWETITVDPEFKSFVHELNDQFDSQSSRISSLRRYMLQRSWRDMTTGTLSSDGRYVYAVEEQGVVDRSSPTRIRRSINEPTPRNYNKLIAYELDSGKSVWELGGPIEETRLPLSGATFLGPPLIQENNLYCLIERRGEIQLISLFNEERPTGRVIPTINWTQSLPLPIDSQLASSAAFMRIQGLSPSISGGVLICGVGQGTVVAFDLGRQLIRWRYRYSLPEDYDRNVRNLLDQVESDYGFSATDESRWIDSVPVIDGGRVFFTPPDADELFCLNLSDGQLLWRQPREQDLYLARVHEDHLLLVGREGVRCRSLSDGSELWQLPLGLPSGRGVSMGTRFILPMMDRSLSVIDVERGRLVGKIFPSENRLTGNLVSSGGFLVSQSHDRVFRYESREELNDRIAAETPESQLLAGQLAFYESGPDEAVPVLQKAWEQQQDDQTREAYLQALLCGLRNDFENYVDRSGGISVLAQTQGERAEFNRVLIKGLVESREPLRAIEELLEHAGEPQTFLYAGALRVRSDIWARSQVHEIYSVLSPEDQNRARTLIASRWSEIENIDNPVEQMRATEFMAALPGMESLRLKLALETDPYTRSLEREQELRALANLDDREVALHAMAQQFRLLMKHERVEQADRVRREILSTEFEGTLPGQELSVDELSEWGLQNEKLSEFVSKRAKNWSDSAVELDGPRQTSGFDGGEVPLVVKGDPGEFRGWSFLIDRQTRRFSVLDSYSHARGTWTLSALSGRTSELQFGGEIQLRGHMGILKLSDQFFVLDLLNGGEAPRLLHGPHDLATPMPGVVMNQRLMRQHETLRLPNGNQTVAVFDMFHQPFGEVELVEGGPIVYQMESHLKAIDSLTGEEYWERPVSGRGNFLCGTADRLTVVSLDDQAVESIRTRDGTRIDRFPVPGMQQILGHVRQLPIVVVRSGERYFVQQLDPDSRGVLWNYECDSKALFQMIDSQKRLVICESAHRIRIVDAENGVLVSDRVVPSEEDLISFQAIPLRDRLLVTLREFSDAQSPFVTRTISYNYPQVNGPVLMFAADGSEQWRKVVRDQGLNPWQAVDSPAWIFMCRRTLKDQRNTRPEQRTAWELIDLETGQTLGESGDESSAASLSFYDLSPVVQPSDSEVDFVGNKWLLKLKYTPKAGEQPEPN